MSPTLVHFSDGTEPRVVMNLDGEPRRGDEFIYGWVVERHQPVSDKAVGYELEVWVQPRQ
jgi:hypothetical protein